MEAAPQRVLVGCGHPGPVFESEASLRSIAFPRVEHPALAVRRLPAQGFVPRFQVEVCSRGTISLALLKSGRARRIWTLMLHLRGDIRAKHSNGTCYLLPELKCTFVTWLHVKFAGAHNACQGLSVFLLLQVRAPTCGSLDVGAVDCPQVICLRQSHHNKQQTTNSQNRGVSGLKLCWGRAGRDGRHSVQRYYAGRSVACRRKVYSCM